MQSFSPFEVLAYFDPGSGSLLVQALVGGGAGLLVFGKYLWEVVFNLSRMRAADIEIPADKRLVEAGSQASRQ